MEICRLWGQPPDWYAGLPRAQQIDLMAWWRVHIDPDRGTKPPPPQPPTARRR